MKSGGLSGVGEAAESLLVMDTCGERGSVALFRGEQLLAEEILPERTASAALLGALRAVLAIAGVPIGDLAGVGVVNGPGSFTGVRVGLAVAKGLCEARGVALAAVSRLAVLAEAGRLQEGYAVLRAGRDQLYVRAVGGGPGDGLAWERLMSVTDFLAAAGSADVVYAEAEVGPMLGGCSGARLVVITAGDAVGLVRECLCHGGSDLAAVDANYVRDEGAIYRQSGERTFNAKVL